MTEPRDEEHHGHFSEGQEADTPAKEREGHFSEGQEKAHDDIGHGHFSEGQEKLPEHAEEKEHHGGYGEGRK